MKPDPDAQTQMLLNVAGGLGGVFVLLFLLGMAGQSVRDRAFAAAYRQLTTGQATVISYTVPGSGVCRAVLVDGKRHGETCEGEGE